MAVEKPKASRPEMAPQRLETIESAPGNVWPPEASTPKISGWRTLFWEGTGAILGTAVTTGRSVRGGIGGECESIEISKMARQGLEKIGLAHGNGMAPGNLDPQDLVAGSAVFGGVDPQSPPDSGPSERNAL